MDGGRSGQINLANDRGQDYLSPPYSSDGSKFVFYIRINAPQQIYITNSDGSERTQLANNSDNDISPSLNPDGTKIVVQSDRDGNIQIYRYTRRTPTVRVKPKSQAILRMIEVLYGRRIVLKLYSLQIGTATAKCKL